MEKKLQDKSFLYSFIRVLAGRVLCRSYRKFQVIGKENIPTDGCTIWASNHTNAMMDPLVVLNSTTPAKVFVARADIFRKPFIAKLLRFLKMMPIYRIRDGINSVKRNDEIMSRSADVLKDGTPLVIFPEATHRAKHSLLPLSKGVFHMAFSVEEIVKGEKPVYILPLTLDYGDYFRFRSTVLVHFGQPINITEFLKENQELTQPQQFQKLRKMLTDRLAQILSYVPDDADYDAVWEYAKLKAADREYFAKVQSECENAAGRKFESLEALQAVDRYAIAEALKLKEEQPEKAAELFQQIDQQRVWRIQHGVSVRSIGGRVSWAKVVGKAFIALLGLPYYIFSAIVSALVWIPTLFVLSKVDDDAFYNTARYAVRLALSWIYVILFAVLFFCKLPLIPAIILTLLLLPAYNYLIDYREFTRMCLSDIRWLLSKRKRVEF